MNKCIIIPDSFKGTLSSAERICSIRKHITPHESRLLRHGESIYYLQKALNFFILVTQRYQKQGTKI